MEGVNLSGSHFLLVLLRGCGAVVVLVPAVVVIEPGVAVVEGAVVVLVPAASACDQAWCCGG